MIEIIKDTLIDSIKLLPFLFITYILMEYIEHKMGKKSKEIIKKSDKYGPLFGSILVIFPQCGFSVSATNLYAARVITLGTLISVYLSTSDEMLPIFISESVSPIIILKILGTKLIIGIIAGFIIDLVIRLIKRKQTNLTSKDKKINQENEIKDLCEEEHCHCNESGITINYGVSNIKRAKIQNIKTNMLLIEAKTKEYVENANYDLGIKPNEATAEMKGKAISELEGEGKGTKVTTSSSISTELNIMGITSEEISNGNVYQISTTDLEKMGIKGVESSEKKGWYIVVYDITNSNVKIYNTKGIKNKQQRN